MTTPSLNPICPQLGSRRDSQTALAYPSNGNSCYRCRPAATPVMEHQRHFCLTPRYSQCPVFISEAIGPLPDALHEPDTREPDKRKMPLNRILFFVILFLCVLFLAVVIKIVSASFTVNGQIIGF